MTEEARTLAEKARELSPSERASLVDDLLDSLDRADPRIDRLWAKEAQDRLAAWRRGDIRAIELGEVIAKYRP
jgi:putative addiction module component (TIGR02574 family)